MALPSLTHRLLWGDTMAQKNIETCFNYTSREAGYFSSNESKYINKVHKLKEQFPDRVTIIAEPEDNDGTIYAKMPISFFRLQASHPRIMTDEEKDALRKLLHQRRKK